MRYTYRGERLLSCSSALLRAAPTRNRLKSMEIHIFDQQNVARTYCTYASRSIFSPPLSICKAAYFQRDKFQSCIVNTATLSQAGRSGTVSKCSFVEPKWMLPVDDKARTGVTHQTSSESVFEVVLTTSKDFGSGISDVDAGVLLAFIGEQGRCFVHQIPAFVSAETVDSGEQTQELWVSKPCRQRFDRGSQEPVTFCGPDLGKLEAVWVAPERGTWRMEGMAVRVIPEQLCKDDINMMENSDCKVMQYDFMCEEFLIGENDNNLAVELKPFKVSEIPYDGQLLSGLKFMERRLQVPSAQLRDEGIKEYEALKFSLLGYDAVLVTLGSAIAAAMSYKEVAKGYLVGGVLGFLYLFILEKAVDQLPAPSQSPSLASGEKEFSEKDSVEMVEGRSAAKLDENGISFSGKNKSMAGFRGPLAKLSGVLVLSFLIANSLNPTNSWASSKQMLLAGAAGFLMTKLATILASNMPISIKQVPTKER